MPRAVLLTTALTGLFFAYFVFVAPLLPEVVPLVLPLLHLVAIPAAFGAMAYFGSRAAPWRLAWLIALPVLVPLPTLLYLGGDPAKPGLENLVYAGIVIVAALAEAAAWLTDRFVVRSRHVNVEA